MIFMRGWWAGYLGVGLERDCMVAEMALELEFNVCGSLILDDLF
jgi:hypothetical protein